MRSTRSLTAFSLTVMLLAFAVPSWAGRADDSKRKSKNGLTEGVIDGVEIVLEYGRPQVKEREVWGGLVPYDKLWRTGADEATTITLSGPAEVQGNRLDAGTYSVFTIPGEGEWTVIFNSVAEQWGAYKYDAEKDVLRVQATPQEAEWTEAMEFTLETGAFVLRWENLALPIAVAAAE